MSDTAIDVSLEMIRALIQQSLDGQEAIRRDLAEMRDEIAALAALVEVRETQHNRLAGRVRSLSVKP